jgi:hypothetical protein
MRIATAAFSAVASLMLAAPPSPSRLGAHLLHSGKTERRLGVREEKI